MVALGFSRRKQELIDLKIFEKNFLANVPWKSLLTWWLHCSWTDMKKPVICDIFCFMFYSTCLSLTPQACIPNGTDKVFFFLPQVYIFLYNTCSGGWWHFKWGGQANIVWNRINGMVSNTSNTWLPCVWYHFIHFIPFIFMKFPPFTSLLY